MKNKCMEEEGIFKTIRMKFFSLFKIALSGIIFPKDI